MLKKCITIILLWHEELLILRHEFTDYCCPASLYFPNHISDDKSVIPNLWGMMLEIISQCVGIDVEIRALNFVPCKYSELAKKEIGDVGLNREISISLHQLSKNSLARSPRSSMDAMVLHTNRNYRCDRW
jgi:hypothetical protein